MAHQARLSLIVLLSVLALAAPGAAQAAAIPTDDAIRSQQAAQERERVKTLAARPEVARELAKLGVAPQDVGRRLDAMSDEEVRLLAGRLDALPAGGSLSNTDLLIVVLIALVIVLIL